MIDQNPFDRLDDAIDRTVREMTHATADERAVARVMARLREADAPAAGNHWMLSPRVAWCGILAVLLMALMSWHSRHWFQRSAEEPRVAAIAPQPSSPQSSSPQPRQPHQSPSLSARDFPTPMVTAPSTVQATTAARIARRGETVRPTSVASGKADANERRESEMTPFESDIELASIMPAPLGDTPAIHIAPAVHVAPLTTTALTVDEIPVTSIDMPPVSPE